MTVSAWIAHTLCIDLYTPTGGAWYPLLETLRIRDFALIDQVEVDFHRGFNALSGETGAGKSILIGALDLVLGARASADVLRSGAKQARIEAVFQLPNPAASLLSILEANGIELEDERLLLARAIGADGRSRGYAGGRLIPISVLAAIGDELVDLHGQHEHQSLLKAERQMALLDAYGGSVDAAEKVAEQVTRLRALEREIKALESDDRDRLRQMEFLRHEVKEIEAAALSTGEETELKSRLARITHAETVREKANHAYALLYEREGGAAIDAVDGALSDLEAIGEIDPQLMTLAAQLAEARTQIEAVAAEVRGYTEAVEFDPGELEELNQRQALLSALKRKYGDDIEAVLAYREKAAAELAAYEGRDACLETLRTEQAALDTRVRAAAERLSKKRKSTAKKLDKRVASALQDLDMKGARFETRFETTGLSTRGIDRIAFQLAANTGEPMKALRQVASGGEVSRIMLALKSVFAEADAIPTLIFDEIDAGVGGAVARKVAAKLTALADTHQVLCITHIAQIAAVANAHYQVEKSASRGRTSTRVVAVEGEERIREVARLLDGSLTKVSIEHARTLLAECG